MVVPVEAASQIRANMIRMTGNISSKERKPIEKFPTSAVPQVVFMVLTDRLKASTGPTPSMTITGMTK
jgi:hypothetical protein